MAGIPDIESFVLQKIFNASNFRESLGFIGLFLDVLVFSSKCALLVGQLYWGWMTECFELANEKLDFYIIWIRTTL